MLKELPSFSLSNVSTRERLPDFILPSDSTKDSSIIERINDKFTIAKSRKFKQ